MGESAGAVSGGSVSWGSRFRALLARMLEPLLGRAVVLPAELLARWPELGAARWRRGGLPPRIGGWCLGTSTVAAITLYDTIWLAPGARLDPELLLHELRHVQQFASSATFPLQYAWESARRGYLRNRFETDANAYAAHRVRTSLETSTKDV